MNLTILFYNLWFRRRGGSVVFPLSAPRHLSATQDSSGVTFSWAPPLSFGSAGPSSTAPYRYRTRISQVGGPAITTRPWTGWATRNALNVTLAWQSANTEIIQIQVQATDANGAHSVGANSPIITEGVTPGHRPGPWNRAFSRAFRGGGA